MAAAGALDDRDKVVIGSISAVDDIVAGHILELVRVGERDAFQHLGDEAIRLIEKLVHSFGGYGVLTSFWETDRAEVLGIAVHTAEGGFVLAQAISSPVI